MYEEEHRTQNAVIRISPRMESGGFKKEKNFVGLQRIYPGALNQYG